MHNSRVNLEFYRFWEKKITYLREMVKVLKNISVKKKVHNSKISHKNREFCPIFIEIIAYVRGKKNQKKKKTRI